MGGAFTRHTREGSAFPLRSWTFAATAPRASGPVRVALLNARRDINYTLKLYGFNTDVCNRTVVSMPEHSETCTGTKYSPLTNMARVRPSHISRANALEV